MKIRSVSVVAFGTHKNTEWRDLEGDRPIVILGPNEAGKSTLFRILQTLLFGFDPASRERHPDLPWYGHRIEVGAEFSTDDGSDFEITRRLLTRPEATLKGPDSIVRLNNRPLPFVHEMDRKTYAALYALTLPDLAESSADTVHAVYERLFDGSSRNVRQVRDVMEELRQEANRYFRADRRGKPKSGELLEKIRKHKQERREAKELFVWQQRLREEREQTRAQRQMLGDELNTVKQRLGLAPIARSLDHIAGLQTQRNECFRGEFPRHLPMDPWSEAKRLQAELKEGRERLAQVQSRVAQLHEDQQAAQAIPAKSVQSVREILHELEQVPILREQAEDSRRRSSDLMKLALEEASEWFAKESLETRVIPRLRTGVLSVSALRQEIRSFSRQQVLWDRQRFLAASNQAAAPLWVASLGGALAAIGLSIVAIQQSQPWLGVSAAVALLVAVIPLWFRQRRREEGLYGDLQEEMIAHRQRIESQLQGFPLRNGVLDEPSELLADSLERMGRWLKESDQERRRSRSLNQRMQVTVERAETILMEHGRELSEDPNEHLHALHELREHYLNLQSKSTTAKDQLKVDEPLLAKLQKRLRDLQGQLKELRDNVLTCVADQEFEIACGRLSRARSLQDRIDQGIRQLRIQYPNLNEDRQWIKKLRAAGTFTGEVEDESADQRQKEILEQELRALHQRFGEIEEVLRRQGPSLSELDSEIAELEQEHADCLLKHDRLILAQALLRASQQRFRDQHQPEVLRFGSQYLQQLTEGRYEKLFVEEDGRLSVSGPALQTTMDPDPATLSRGTQDQIQLALRLAMAAHLDLERSESLPLILDEALVNFDPLRLDAAFRLLQKLAARTQVVLLTCHPWFAERAKSLMGAKCVNLGTTDLKAMKAFGNQSS